MSKRKIPYIQDGAIFLTCDFDKEGYIASENCNLDVNFSNHYSNNYLEIKKLKPYIAKLSEENSSFLVLIFADCASSVIKFLANHYHVRVGIEILDIKNHWVLPNLLEEVQEKLDSLRKDEE
jgi:hypothetical protein